MESVTAQLGTLEKPIGTMKILVHLHRNKITTITTLLKVEKLNQRSTYSALRKLQDHGLIFQKETLGFPVCKYYFLTDRGKKVAQQLEVVAEALEKA